MIQTEGQYRRAAVFAGETVDRLQREGLSSDAAQDMVLKVIQSEAEAVIKESHPFDGSRCIERLRKLPGCD